MGLIKSSLAPPSLTPFSMRDIEGQAQALLLRTRRTAESLLVEAQKEAENLRQQAKLEGFAQGHREGTSKGLQEGTQAGHQAGLNEMKGQLGQTWAALNSALTQLDAARKDLETSGIMEVIALASGIARRVTKRQSMLDPEVLTENLREAMKLAVASADVRIVINPAQRKTLAEQLPRLQMNWPNLKHIELLDDPAIGSGGCRILTRHGEINAEIEGQLDRVIADLLPTEESAEP